MFQPVLQICTSNFLHHQTVKRLCAVSWRKCKITVAIDFWNTRMSQPDQYVGFLLKQFYSFGMFFEQDFDHFSGAVVVYFKGSAKAAASERRD